MVKGKLKEQPKQRNRPVERERHGHTGLEVEAVQRMMRGSGRIKAGKRLVRSKGQIVRSHEHLQGWTLRHSQWGRF